MEKELEFNYKTKYYKLGEINSETKQVWWVLHGYGQLGKFFIQKFKSLAENKVCIIAPEGILWAGLFPTDMNFEKGNYLLKGKEIVQVIGRQDPFITKEKIDEMEKLNQKLKLNPKIMEFDGGHEIDLHVLLTLAFN